MSEDQDDKLTELYRKSSQETPAAHVDRAVMDMARKSVRRKLYSPFGASWLVRGATVGVMVLGVLLILSEPQKSAYLEFPQEAVAPTRAERELNEERMESDAGLSGQKHELNKKQVAPAASEPHFDFYEILPDMEVVVPDDETGMRARQAPVKAAPAPESALESAPAPPPASKAMAAPVEKPAAGFYLQAGSFRDEQRALAMCDTVVFLGLDCHIEKARVEAGKVYYRVRVGPFTTVDEREVARAQLETADIETQPVHK